MTDRSTLAKLASARLLFLGPPGSGKGTQCKRLKAELGLPHLSTGDILRHGIADGRPECIQAKSYIDSGNLVPDDLMIAIIRARLSKPDCQRGFILDGFPRTLVQARSLDDILTQLRLSLTRVFNLLIDDVVIVDRIAGRLNCGNDKCGAVYNSKNAPPKVPGICDICGNPLQQRDDDKPDIVKERLKVYKEQTAPLIGYYKERSLLTDIDGALSQDEIYAEITRKLEAYANVNTGGK